MIKLILAMMCAPMFGSAASSGNKALAVYWLTVGVYWMINFLEGSRHEG